MLSVTPTIDMQQQAKLYVEVVYEGDEALANNKSELFDVKVRMPNLPEAQNLKVAGGEGVVLSWDAPAPIRTADETVTDSFEDYDDFAMSSVLYSESEGSSPLILFPSIIMIGIFKKTLPRKGSSSFHFYFSLKHELGRTSQIDVIVLFAPFNIECAAVH